MKTAVFYDEEKETGKLLMIKKVNYDINVHELTRITLFDDDSFRNAIVNTLGIDDEEANKLLENDDVRRGLLLMVAHEIINHPTRY